MFHKVRFAGTKAMVYAPKTRNEERQLRAWSSETNSLHQEVSDEIHDVSDIHFPGHNHSAILICADWVKVGW